MPIKTHLDVFRSESGGENKYKRFLSLRKTGTVNDWTATLSFSPGDIVLFYFGNPVKAIVAIGIVESNPRKKPGKFDWTSKKTVVFCDFAPVWFLANPIPLAEIAEKAHVLDWYKGKPYRSSREISQKYATALLTEIVELNPWIAEKLEKVMKLKFSKQRKKKLIISEKREKKKYKEGALFEIIRELKSRNYFLRNQALLEKGLKCEVCGFEFEKAYGILGIGYIEVHHLKPLSNLKRETNLSTKDVAVVCANCHRVLHHNGKVPISVQKLKKIVKKRRKVSVVSY